MLEFIQVTAQYSNAVLLAILPHVWDFAKRAELPMPIPVGLHQVVGFNCFPVKDQVGGLVILTNGLRVWYHNGYVNGFRTSQSYYNLQDARDVPRFYGSVKLSKDEALQFARSNIVKLGYTLKETFTDQEPEIDLPPEVGTNVVPHFRLRWKDPVFSTTAVSIEVDAGRRVIQEMNLLSPFFWRAGPKISVEPTIRNPKPSISASVSNQFVSGILPKVTEFSRKLELPVRLPLNDEQIEQVVFVNDNSDVRIRLTNGYWFAAKNGVVVGFNAPDSVYGRQAILDPFPDPLEQYLGEWKLSETESIELARRAIRKLGYTLEEFSIHRAPDAIAKRDPVGKYIVPRFYFRWLTNNPETKATISVVRAEVDANHGRLKYLELIGPNLSGTGQTREWFPHRTNTPLVMQPMIFDTNAPSRFTPDPELSEIIRQLDRLMVLETNKAPKPVPTVKPANPFE